MSEPTYTLNEARAEMRRRECEKAGHAPSHHIATIADRVGLWLCECGAKTWNAS